MKRLHIHVGVKDLEKSVQFYSTLFGQKPAKEKTGYAKWMLEDPRINFAISTFTKAEGIDHLGIQVDEPKELEELTERLKKADMGIYDEGETTCCYAKSDKAWVQDPSGVAWELFPQAEIQSAGSQPGKLNPFAAQVMKEIGIDISKHYSKSTDDLSQKFLATLDYVITLCAEEVCPVLILKAKKLHWPFPDPASKTPLPEEEALRRFREARDAIAAKLKEFKP